MALILFDLDNTLIESRIDFPAVRRDLVEALGGGVDGSRLSIGELVALAPEDDRARLWAMIERHEADGMRGAEAVAGAGEVLAALRARGHGIALLTNNGRQATLEALGRLGLEAAFDLVIARDDAPRMKPDASGIEEIRVRLGRDAPCVLVGDSWLDGLAAARAGISFVAYRPRRESLDAHGIVPAHTIEDLRDLLNLPL